MARKKYPMKFAQPKFPNGCRVKVYQLELGMYGAVVKKFIGVGTVMGQLGEETVDVFFDDDKYSTHVLESNLERID